MNRQDYNELKEIKTNTEQDEIMRYLKYNEQIQYLFEIMEGEK